MKRHVVAKVDEIAPGTSKIVTVNGREVGVFNVKGEFFALANRCPHQGGALCLGRVGGLVVSGGPGEYRVVRPGEFVKCPWHAWEFDIRTGQSYCDPNSVKVRAYDIEVATGEEIAKGPFVAETFAVSVEENYLVIEA